MAERLNVQLCPPREITQDGIIYIFVAFVIFDFSYLIPLKIYDN